MQRTQVFPIMDYVEWINQLADTLYVVVLVAMSTRWSRVMTSSTIYNYAASAAKSKYLGRVNFRKYDVFIAYFMGYVMGIITPYRNPIDLTENDYSNSLDFGDVNQILPFRVMQICMQRYLFTYAHHHCIYLHHS